MRSRQDWRKEGRIKAAEKEKRRESKSKEARRPKHRAGIMHALSYGVAGTEVCVCSARVKTNRPRLRPPTRIEPDPWKVCNLWIRGSEDGCPRAFGAGAGGPKVTRPQRAVSCPRASEYDQSWTERLDRQFAVRAISVPVRFIS